MCKWKNQTDNNIILQLQRRADTYRHDSDTIFFPCKIRHTPEMGKLLESFCFANLKELNLKISEDRHEFFHLLKWNADNETWDDWSVCIKQIVQHASQLPKQILEMPQNQWKKYFFMDVIADKLGVIKIDDLTSVIKSNGIDLVKKQGEIIHREIYSGFYPEDNTNVHLEGMFNITTPCLNALGKHIANAIRCDLLGKQSYMVAIIGCVGSPLNTINLCVAILKFLHTRDVKVQFCVYETNEQKYNDGVYNYVDIDK